MEKEVKIAMVMSASSALKYLESKPHADTEEVLKHVMKEIRLQKEEKIAGIAAANFVLKYKEKKPKATEKEVMQNLANSTTSILEEIER